MADGSDFETQVLEGTNVGLVKLSKSRSKATFTRCRHSLLKLLDDAVVERKEIRAKQEQLADSMEKAMALFEQLVTIYNESGDTDNIEKTSTEMETLESEFSSAMKLAQRQ